MDPQTVEALFATATGLISTWGLKVVGAIVVLIVGRMVAGWGRGVTRRHLTKSSVDDTLVPFLSNIVYTLLLAFVIVAVLGLFGIPTASVVAVIGAAGLAVGLAMQGTLSNFAAGVMLLVFRPFKIGDWVVVGGTEGTIREIGLFATLMDKPDNVRSIVPNGKIWGETIVNFSANDLRRVDMVFGVAYADDLQLASDTLRKVTEAHPAVLADPAPQVAVKELADSSVNFVVRPWVKGSDYWTVYFDLHRQMKEGLESAGCSIPFPQRDIHLHQVDGAA